MAEWRAWNVQQGLFSARPAAAATNKGYGWYATDTGAHYRSDGSTWHLVGSGIQFDTTPQTGTFLDVATTGVVGLTLATSGGGTLALGVTGGGDLFLSSTGKIVISGTDATFGIRVTAQGPGYFVATNGLQLTAVSAADPVILASTNTSVGGGIYVRCEEKKITIHASAGSNPATIGQKWLVIDTASGGSYHMKTGATWTADL